MQRPFWLHQIVEYILGMLLISQGLQLREPLTLTVAGVMILVNAATVSGPMSAFKWTTRGIHRTLDLVLIAGLVVLGLQPVWTMDSTSRTLLLAVAVVMFMVWRITDYRPPALRSTRPARAERLRSQTRPKVTERRSDPEQIGRAAGRAAGGVIRRWRQQG